MPEEPQPRPSHHPQLHIQQQPGKMGQTHGGAGKSAHAAPTPIPQPTPFLYEQSEGEGEPMDETAAGSPMEEDISSDLPPPMILRDEADSFCHLQQQMQHQLKPHPHHRAHPHKLAETASSSSSDSNYSSLATVDEGAPAPRGGSGTGERECAAPHGQTAGEHTSTPPQPRTAASHAPPVGEARGWGSGGELGDEEDEKLLTISKGKAG